MKVYKKKRKSSGNYRDVVNSKKLTGHKFHKAFAQEGTKNDGFVPYSVNDPNFTDKFNTPIPPERQKEFEDWAKMMSAKNGKDVLGDRYDYDVQGLFLSGEGSDARGHSTDRFKKPNHPTFSNESIYSNPFLGEQGGQWGDNSFTAGSSNKKYRSKGSLDRYMKKVEPGVKLMSEGGVNKVYKKKFAQSGISNAGDGVKNPYDPIFDQVSKEKGIPKEILTALAAGESSFNRDSIGKMTKSGQAVGIMQLMPATIKSLGITDPNDPYQNISGGAQWLKNAYDRTGNWKDAVGEYNSGPKTWRENKAGVMKESPKYYKDIYAAIDQYSGTQKPLSIPKFTPAVADKTMVANTRIPGKDNLFPIQRSTLPSINKPLPQVKNEGIRPATEGYEQDSGGDISQWMELYDNPDLATDPGFISNLFKPQMAEGGKNENYDDLSFGKAFSTARKSGADQFNWKGKPYTTQLKEEVGQKKTQGDYQKAEVFGQKGQYATPTPTPTPLFNTNVQPEAPQQVKNVFPQGKSMDEGIVPNLSPEAGIDRMAPKTIDKVSSPSLDKVSTPKKYKNKKMPFSRNMDETVDRMTPNQAGQFNTASNLKSPAHIQQRELDDHIATLAKIDTPSLTQKEIPQHIEKVKQAVNVLNEVNSNKYQGKIKSIVADPNSDLPTDVQEKQGQLAQDPKWKTFPGKYFIYSKENSTFYVFDKDHKMVDGIKAIRGIDPGDDLNKSNPDIEPKSLAGRKTTPAGSYAYMDTSNDPDNANLQKDYQNDYGTPFFQFYSDQYGQLGTHGVYKGELGELGERNAVLYNPDILQKLYSYGCINVPKEWLMSQGNTPVVGDSLFITKEPTSNLFAKKGR